VPTYTCSIARGVLSADQRQRIATGISRIHSEATGAPIGFCQCLFHDTDYAGHFIGGEPTPRASVFVYGHIRGGRVAEQRDQILTQIRDLLVEVIGIDSSLVWVYINELRHTDMVEFGHVLPEQGQEEQWVAALPTDLRDRLLGLGRQAHA
jgi:phenylpyruvate tautomerase PptA (4-oxalocrotonate tautomerase family)